jgi:hypothetical protein
MINQTQPGAVTFERIGQAGAKYFGQLGSLFSVALQGIYAAHMEKAQMRFAPTPIYSERVVRRRR